MPMPASIKIGPMVYTVEHSYEAMREYNRRCDGNTEYCGVARHGEATIIVSSDMPACRTRAVLLHEISHCLSDVYAMEAIDHKADEYHDLQATAWCSLLRDNPALVAYLTEE